jgi:voltage-gated potassium channel
VPLVVIAFAYLGLYALPILWPELPDWLNTADEVASVLVWLVFVADLALRARLSSDWRQYLWRHPIDFLLVALPMLRPLRVLRVFTAANYIVTRGGRLAVGRTVMSAAAATALVMLVASLAVLEAERGAPDSSINSFGDALWWSGVTVTTVGYGDVYPVTTTGRVAAFGLMLVGIAVLGLVTASVAAWFVERTRDVEDDVLVELREQRQVIEALRVEVAALRERRGAD